MQHSSCNIATNMGKGEAPLIDDNPLSAWNAPRKCDYCDKTFTPTRPQDKKRRFCCDNHRKDFFRYGAKLRILTALRRDFDQDLAKLEQRIAALEKKAVDKS